MKRFTLLKTMLLLCALIVGSVNGWADDVETTYQFVTDRNWKATCDDEEADWISNKRANGFTANQGIQVTASDDGANATSPKSFTNIKKITVKYCTNKSAGTGKIKVKVGDGTEKSLDVSYSSGDGRVLKTHDFDFSPSETGSVTLTVNCSTNSLYIYSITITEEGSSDPSSGVAFANSTPTLDFKDADTFTQTATTVDGYSGTDGASVTYTITSNSAGASIDEATGEVTPTTTGSVTVKATAAAIAGKYSQSTATYTLTISDTRTEAGLEYAEDEQEVNVDEVLSAPTLTNPNGLSVTYSSDDETIATVDAAGNVTGKKNGSTTINASFAGNRTYKAATVSYTINVIVPLPVGCLLFEGMSGYTGSSDVSTELSTSYANLDSKEWNSFSKVYAGKVISGDQNGHIKFGSSSAAGTAVTKSLSLSGSGKLTYKVQRYDSSNTGNLKITVSGADATGDLDVTGTASWVEKTVNLSNATGNVVITFATTSSNKRIRVDDIELVQLASINLAEACTDGVNYYGTYSSSKAFKVPSDLTVSEIKVVDGKLSLSSYSTGDVVPANTGVMIASATKGLHTMELAKNGSSKLGSENMLKASGDAGIAAAAMASAAPSCKYYRLTMHNPATDNKIGFWWGAPDGGAFDVAANKAYLAVPDGANARSGFNLFGDDDTTGIEAVDVNTENANVAREYYNLNGQRIANPSKGLYIVNGKKVIIK